MSQSTYEVRQCRDWCCQNKPHHYRSWLVRSNTNAFDMSHCGTWKEAMTWARAA